MSSLIQFLYEMRYPASIISSIVISLILFWLMQTMISNNQHGLKQSVNLQMTEFVRLKRETRLLTKDRKVPEEPPPKKRPPPPEMQVQKAHVKNNIPSIDIPRLDIPLQSDRFKGSLMGNLQMGQGQISTNVISLLRIPPRYPMRAANRRIEGWVKIEFTITEEGTVKDAVVIDAQPSKIFNKDALRAIGRWKFKAKILDGEAFEQRAIQVLTFKLKK